MNTCFSILTFIFLSFQSFSQVSDTGTIKFPKAKFDKVERLNELIVQIPSDCKVIGFIFSTDYNKSLREFYVRGEGLPKEVKNLAKKTGVFTVEKLQTSCNDKHKSTYKIILE